MSNLRIQLDRAKAEYHSAAYPGDLASELLSLRLPTGDAALTAASVRSTRNRWFWATGTGTAAAAALVGAFMLSSSTPNMPGDYGSAGYVWSPSRGAAEGGSSNPNPFVLSATPVPPAGNRFLLDERSPGRLGRGIEMVESPSTKSAYREFDIRPDVRTMEFDVPKR